MVEEKKLDTTCSRSVWALDAAEYIGQGSAFWFEWNHPLETSRSFAGIMNDLKAQHWNDLLPAGCTAIDIGTHSGDTALAMGLFNFDKPNDRRGNVIAIEPNPDLYDLCTLCLTINSHIANFRFETCAITEQDMDEVTLSDHGNSNCNGGIVADYSEFLKNTLQTSAKVTYTAKGRSLGSLLSDYHDDFAAESVKFVKTDCEGFDKQILRSSRDFLDQVKPTLFVEWFAWFTPEDDDSLFSIIDECGYIALNPYTLTLIDRTQRTSDITCIHKSVFAK